MSLFPAYATPMPDISHLEKIVIETPKDEPKEEQTVNSSDEELELLEPKVKNEPKPAKKKHKKRKKSSKEIAKLKPSELHLLVNAKDDFYIDCKIDYGNLRVSTLYNPARPKYERSKTLVGSYLSNNRNRRNIIRYYKASITDADKTDDNVNVSKKNKKKNTKDFIVITDSGQRWNEEEVEMSLLNKTAEFNKYLDSNPYDVERWLEFVKFQEERLAFDISNKNIASATTAQSNCSEKQLSILDAALKHNFNSMKLLYKKVNISQQFLSPEEYMDMLKNLITTPDLSLSLLIRGWFWYLDAIKCSMALCSVPSVKEVYIGAIKALHKAQKQSYQATHVDITYRLGLFLRQAGLWEQLWMLLKLNLETNLAVSRSGGSFDLESTVDPIDTVKMLDEEHNIITSGLPLHEIWSRIESVRNKVQWLPASEEADDPQRNVFSTDFADFIKPISNKSHMFVLTVNMLRLLKIPLIPQTNRMVETLNVSGYAIDWELDCIESSLPFIYHMVNGMETLDGNKLKIMAQIMKDFIKEPSYIDMSADYFKFANSVMVQCSHWFEGPEKSAILVWWIRYLQTTLAIYICNHSYNETTKKVITNIKKVVKDILKSNRDDIIIYTEYAILEVQTSGIEKGLSVMEMCLKALPNEKSISRVHLVRTYLELMLKEPTKIDNGTTKSIIALISLSSDKSIADFCSVSEQSLIEALDKFSEYTDKLLLNVANSDKDIQLVDCMLPDLTIDWICCHGWLIILMQEKEELIKFYKKILAATFVISDEITQHDSKRKLQVREGFFQWIMLSSQKYFKVSEAIEEMGLRFLEQALETFSYNSCIVWFMTSHLNQRPSSRWRLLKLIKKDESSPILALALILHNFISLYKKHDPLFTDTWQPGHNNRLLNLLNAIVDHPLLKKCALIWHMLIEFAACHTAEPTTLTKKYLYRALDECPWNKELYYTGCVRVPAEFSGLIDIMVEKQIRVHAMPEELNV